MGQVTDNAAIRENVVRKTKVQTVARHSVLVYSQPERTAATVICAHQIGIAVEPLGIIVVLVMVCVAHRMVYIAQPNGLVVEILAIAILRTGGIVVQTMENFVPMDPNASTAQEAQP